MSIREGARAAQLPPRQKVGCPEWGGDVYVRAANAAEVERWQLSNGRTDEKTGRRESDLVGSRARLVVLVAQEEDGTAAFTPGDAGWLAEGLNAPLDRCYAAAVALAGLAKDAPEKNAG